MDENTACKHHAVNYTIPGRHKWRKPNGVEVLQVQIFGAGGCGMPEGGGEAGEYLPVTLSGSEIPDETEIVVGEGGSSGSAGGNSSFGEFVARGGSAGSGGGPPGQPGNNGAVIITTPNT